MDAGGGPVFAPPRDANPERRGCCGGYCPRFSSVSSTFLALLGLIASVMLLAAPLSSIVLLPFVALPPLLVGYFGYVRTLRPLLGDAADDDLVLRVFAAGFVPAAAVASLVEFFVGIIIFLMCFGEQFAGAARASEPIDGDGGGGGVDVTGRGVTTIVYLLLSAFITAACVEEVIKVGVVRSPCCCCAPERACCIQRQIADPQRQAYMTMSLVPAAAVGFATVENLLFVINFLALRGGLGESVLVAVSRGALSLPIHAICGAFSGLRLTIRDVQRRQRDTAALGRGDAPAFVMLQSGVVVQVVAADPVNAPAAAAQGDALGIVAPAGAAAGTAAAAARQVTVWSWARVLWPSILIHGTFDFVMYLFELVDDEVGAFFGAAASSVLILVASGWALRSQLNAVLNITARGRVPERVTCAPLWWPQWLREGLARGEAGREHDGVDADAEGYPLAVTAPMLGDVGGPTGEPRYRDVGAEGLLGGDGGRVEATSVHGAQHHTIDMRVVTDGAAVVEMPRTLGQQ